MPGGEGRKQTTSPPEASDFTAETQRSQRYAQRKPRESKPESAEEAESNGPDGNEAVTRHRDGT